MGGIREQLEIDRLGEDRRDRFGNHVSQFWCRHGTSNMRVEYTRDGWFNTTQDNATVNAESSAAEE